MHPGTMLTDAVREWPTPLAQNNRKSARAMTPRTEDGGGESSPPRLEQMAELFSGVLPRELEGHPSSRRWATPTTAPEAAHLGSNIMDGPAGLGNQARQTASWMTPTASDSEKGPDPEQSSREGSPTLTTQAVRWPTPTVGVHGQSGSSHSRPNANLEPVAARWSTPLARDGEHNETARAAGGLVKEAKDFFPTPVVTSGGRTLPSEASDTGAMPDGSKRQVDLSEAVRRMYPTPVASDAMAGPRTPGATRGPAPGLKTAVLQMFPTPTASMATPADMEQARYAGNDPRRPRYRDAFPTPMTSRSGSSQNGINSTRPSAGTPSLETAAAHGLLPSLPDQETSRDGASFSPSDPTPHLPSPEERSPRPLSLVLNPVFVECLMGLPPGWTDCERAVTESYRRWLRQHSEPSSTER